MTITQTSRRELTRRFALNSVCDDYENLNVTIAEDVKKLGARCGIYIQTEEVIFALTELIDLGWAKAYRLDGKSSGPPNQLEGMPSRAEMEDFYGAWFYITPTGMQVQLADWEAWPFDEDNNLRKDWTPPEN